MNALWKCGESRKLFAIWPLCKRTKLLSTWSKWLAAYKRTRNCSLFLKDLLNPHRDLWKAFSFAVLKSFDKQIVSNSIPGHPSKLQTIRTSFVYMSFSRNWKGKLFVDFAALDMYHVMTAQNNKKTISNDLLKRSNRRGKPVVYTVKAWIRFRCEEEDERKIDGK